MKTLIGQMQIQVNEKIYLKDPNSSDLGKKIVSQGIILIDEIGLENFTFKKLATRLETTESSVYRYFESKNKLLIYLTSWYWGWQEYQLVFSTSNIPSPEERLKLAIDLIATDIPPNEIIGNVNLEILGRIVISESSKAYLTKEVDAANKEGFYSAYKRLVGRISDIVLEINPKFVHSHTLISTIVEGIHHQKYFADHLPSLTDIKSDSQKLGAFYTDMALAIIKK
ncbi:MAG: TetR family transcriptional regulator [Crocinitomicaceae bacterium]|nr:TetR family transcriptional regulator [Crocinitomicaceae bacterium]|tara:strand:+ start:40989 stop:41666 length:678 start_codon:yes stop_codon:yes gene_type:complete